MAWIDDRLWCHPKLVGLSDRAFRAYIHGLAYSAGMGTRGHLNADQLKLIMPDQRYRSRTKTELCVNNFWHRTETGIVIHDWQEHNRKRDEKRDKDRERKRAYRAKTDEMSHGQGVGQHVGQHVGQGVGQAADKSEDRRALTEVKEVTIKTSSSSDFASPATPQPEPPTLGEGARRAIREHGDILERLADQAPNPAPDDDLDFGRPNGHTRTPAQLFAANVIQASLAQAGGGGGSSITTGETP